MPPRQPPLFHLLLYLLSSNRLSDLLAETTREEAVALSPLPTRFGGLGLSSAQRVALAGWLGSWAQVWGKMVVLFPAVRAMLPHLGGPEGTEVSDYPLAAGIIAAVEDVRGARARVVAALGANPQVRARLLSLSRDGATVHLNALPVGGGYVLRPAAAIKALCLQLGTSVPLVREVSAVVSGRCRVPLNTAAAAERQKALVYGKVAPHKQGGVGQWPHDGRFGEQVESAGGGTARGWFSEVRTPLPARPLVGGPVFEELESPPVPDGLAGLSGTPGGLQAPSVVDNGSEGIRDGTGLVSGVGSPQTSDRLADVLSTPRPSAGMERQAFVGPLFRPVEDEWYGHTMACMPPTSVVTADYEAAFCPMILETVGGYLGDGGGRCRGGGKRAVPLHTVATGGAGWAGTGSRGYTRPRGVEMVGQRLHLCYFGGPRVRVVTEYVSDRGRHVVQFDDDGSCAPVDLSNSRMHGGGVRARGVGAANAATALPADVWATYERSVGDEGGRRSCPLCRTRPASLKLRGLRQRRRPEQQQKVQEEWQQARQEWQERLRQRRQILQEWPQPWPQQADGRDARAVVVPRARRVQRDAAAHDGDPQPSEDDPAFRCPVCSERTAPHPTRMARHLWQVHRPDDYIGMDLTAFGCNVAYLSGAELTTHHRQGFSEEEQRGSGHNDFWRLLGTAPQPRARKKSIPAELVRVRVQQMLAGEWEGLYRAAVPSALVWPARASEERIPETLEALEALHPGGDGLPAPVRAALLVLEEAAVEAECRQMPIASNKVPAEILPWLMGVQQVAVLKLGRGVRPIACGEVLRRLTGKVVCRQMRMRFVAHFGAPPGDGAASSVAQVGVGVQGGAEVCVHTVQALLGEVPSWWVRSAEGTHHGDPLGPFLMAAPLQPVLQAVLRAHPEVYISAYLDDIHILGDPEHVRAAYCKGTFSPSGVCEDFQDVVDAAGDSIPGTDVAFEGIKVQLLLLRYCSRPRFMHLVRGLKSHTLMFGSLEHDDSGVQRCLQEIAGSPYPLGEAAVALSQLPTRRGGAWADLRPAAGAGGLAGVQGACVEAHGDDVPNGAELTPPPGSPGGHPLVACLVSAMEDVRGARLRVLAAEAGEQVMPEGLRIREEAPRWESFGDTRPASQKELTLYQHGSDCLSLFDAATSTVRDRLLCLSQDGTTWHLNALPIEGGFRLKPIASLTSLCLQLGIRLPLVREVSAVWTGRCACGGGVDEFGYHCLTCNRRGMFAHRHNAVQDVLVEMLRK
ncbi:hypothetical protein CYMTET_24238 [Cymbomonas tetramitiformis]|uniref:Reverse transcriptase domain-containing protein n=1 Tax=Cymbomonas tetramitiformis TaxID=36881 RepID=A0AAE0FWR8_9CHLO|nr:hypothetical protein CYMTET_24238 [Cymbomonas tetramitiformis]